MVGVELEREDESANGRIATGRKENVRVRWGDRDWEIWQQVK